MARRHNRPRSHPSLPRPKAKDAPHDRGPRRPVARVAKPPRSAPPALTAPLADLCALDRDGQRYSGPAAAYRLLWEQLGPEARTRLAELATAEGDSAATRRAAAQLRRLLADG